MDHLNITADLPTKLLFFARIQVMLHEAPGPYTHQMRKTGLYEQKFQIWKWVPDNMYIGAFINLVLRDGDHQSTFWRP